MDPNTQTPAQPPATPQQPIEPAPVASPEAPVMPQPAPAAAPVANATGSAENPGKVLGIISLVLPFVGFSFIGLILGIVGLRKSKKAGMSNGFALAGIIVSAISLVVGIIVVAILVLSATSIVQKCQELGPGTHYENGTTYTCS